MSKILKAGDKFKIGFEALPGGYIRLEGDFGDETNATLPPGAGAFVFWKDGGLRLSAEDGHMVYHSLPLATAVVDYCDAAFPHWKESLGPEHPDMPGSNVVIKAKHMFRVLRSVLGLAEPTP